MIDILNLSKPALRKHLKTLRNEFDREYKTTADNNIYNQAINTDLLYNNPDIFIYVSTEIEVDTRKLIDYFLGIKYNVAVPYCIDKNGSMCFYYIKSLSDLQLNHYGILEPDPEHFTMAAPKNSDLCFVPCLGFDSEGYRIGYGKGYYDRFLSLNQIKKIGLCYDTCRVNKIPRDEFDIKLDGIITDKNYYSFDFNNI